MSQKFYQFFIVFYCPNIYTVIVSQTWMGMGAKKIDILTKKKIQLHTTYYVSHKYVIVK